VKLGINGSPPDATTAFVSFPPVWNHNFHLFLLDGFGRAGSMEPLTVVEAVSHKSNGGLNSITVAVDTHQQIRIMKSQ
jgi:hypothetical protein